MPIRAQVEAILDRDVRADRIALVWPEPTDQIEYTMHVKGRSTRLVYCCSELAMREALVNHDDKHCLVLISKFDEVHLAKDVLARIWKNEPQRISPWKTLQQLIKVKEIDPRLTRRHGRWMAEALLHHIERIQSQMSFGEVLDQDSAWRAIALSYLNYNESELDLPSIFKWSLQIETGKISSQLPKDVQSNLNEWLAPVFGELSDVILHFLLTGKHDEIWAIGLACSVIYTNELVSLLDTQLLYSGRGRFVERFLGGLKVSNDVLARFGQEAVNCTVSLLQALEYKNLSAAMSKAEQILASLDFLPAVSLSPVLPASYSLRLKAYADCLERAQTTGNLVPAQTALLNVKQHWLAGLHSNREQLQRADMALRLLGWLTTNKTPASNAREFIIEYRDHGSFADWARTQLWPGDVHEDLNRVYHQLTEKVATAQERQNAGFAARLDAIGRGDQISPELIYVERVLDQLLSKIAELHPVLLLVLDGMSQAVFRELGEHLCAHNWIEVRSTSQQQETCLVAALPTITQISRCSLLSGALCEGGSAEEKKAFANHEQLKRIASTKFPPVLFHKQDLQQSGSGALNSQVRTMIAGTEYRVLGAVINAIDDQLSSSSQVTVRWSLESLPLLRQVLEAAKESGRVVVMTSDHGHVLDHDSQYAGAENANGERYQLPGQPIRQNEVLVSGNRVVTNGKSVVVPISEKLRYTKSKNLGYHGGGTLQEIVIPVGVFLHAGSGSAPRGWTEIPRKLPDWWQLEVVTSHQVQTVSEPSTTKSGKSKLTDSDRTGDLFVEPKPIQSKAVPVAREVGWINDLFASDVYRQMLGRAGRALISEDELRLLLELIEQNGGQVMEAVVIRHLSKPQLRLRGFLAGVQKILNVDGYPILAVDRESQTIRLNIADLKTQFEL